MGLLIAVLMAGSYWLILLFAIRFLRSRFLTRMVFIYILVIALSACVLLLLNFFAFAWVLRLVGFDYRICRGGLCFYASTCSIGYCHGADADKRNFARA